jgi:hypothetical protein
MKKVLILSAFYLFITGCDPVSSNSQMIKNSSKDSIFVLVFLDKVTKDSIFILPNENKIISGDSSFGSWPESSCYSLTDSIFIRNHANKKLKKSLKNANNWTSNYSKARFGGSTQECTFEVTDQDFLINLNFIF